MAGCDIIHEQPCEAGLHLKNKPDLSIAGPHNKKASQSIDLDFGREMHITQQTQTHRGHVRSDDSVPTVHQPPINFSRVSEGLYRSGYPQTPNYLFIQSLNLKTIVTLVNKELPDDYQSFIRENGISHKVFDMTGTKKEDIPIDLMRSIISTVSNVDNYPLLIHCNHGRHRTGCVIGVLRKSCQWNMKHIIDEYTIFAEPKVREVDLKYLADFELTSLLCTSKPHATVAPSNLGRFFWFVIVTILALFAVYPLSKFRVQES